MAAVGSTSWRATAAVEACPTTPWSGEVWRCHSRKYEGASADGSLRTSGRYNRGSDRFSELETWPALYTSLGQHIALGERLRHTTPEVLPTLRNQRISKLRVELDNVLVACAPTGCADLCVPGLTIDDICHPTDYTKTQEFAFAARESFIEALLIPSCTRFPEGNLIIFPDRLISGPGIYLVDSLDPDLFVDWNNLATTVGGAT